MIIFNILIYKIYKILGQILQPYKQAEQTWKGGGDSAS